MNEPFDDIIAEIRRYRQDHAASFDYDLKRITEDLQRQERESGAQVVHRPLRKPQTLPRTSSS